MSFLQHNNRKTVCPPGKFPQGSDVPVIWVPTYMRTGTHLLIDTIFNNFSAYKNTPLYLDLDQWIKAGSSLAPLSCHKGFLIKTHLPSPKIKFDMAQVTAKLQAGVKIITTERGEDAILNSLKQSFGYDIDMQELREGMELFYSYWKQFDRLVFSFEDLIDCSKTASVVERISDFIGVKANPKLVLVTNKKDKGKVYVSKLATRLLGARSPVINTTVGFAKSGS